jgi:hypothetical protein
LRAERSLGAARLAACVVVASALVVVGCSRKVKITLPVVPTTVALRSTTSSSTPIDRSKDSLPVLGTGIVSTTLTFGLGRASIAGVVTGPDGPVEGATVQIERMVGNDSAITRVVTDAAGRYALSNATLGRIRIRAWRSPDVAEVKETVMFTKETVRHDIKVQRYARSDLQWSVAPSPLVVGQQAAVVVQITDRIVNADGVVVIQPIRGVGVRLSPRSFVQIVTVEERLTNDLGRATFNVQCVESGPATVAANLATGGEATLDLPNCVLPPPPSTIPTSDAPATVATAPPTVPQTTFVSAPIVTVPVQAPVPTNAPEPTVPIATVVEVAPALPTVVPAPVVGTVVPTPEPVLVPPAA